MIVRIAGEGQYELDGDHEQPLHDLDGEAVAAVEAGDEPRFRELWNRMLSLVEDEGRPVADDALFGSDVILPPRDVSFEEAQKDFTGEGLIPD